MIPMLTAAGSHPDCRAVLILIAALYHNFSLGGGEQPSRLPADGPPSPSEI